MFLGHLAVGFAAKRVAPETSLGILLVASELVDLLFPIFLLAGVEHAEIVGGDNPFLRAEFSSYPFTHSLAIGCLWALGATGLYWLMSRRRSSAVVVGLVVLSHWFLDALSHTPDMPIYPGASPRFGLGLWNSPSATVIVEGLMFTAAVWLYAASTHARNRRGSYGLWLFVAAMVALYIANIVGPPPPNASAIAWVGIAFIVFLFWAHRFDRQRDAVSTAPQS
jgi:hypothetical protein